MKPKNVNFLTYGSIISICHVENDDSFLISDGFVKRNIMMRNFATSDKLEKMWPYYNTLFQIYPKLSNITKGEIQREVMEESEDDDPNQVVEEIMNGLMVSHPDEQEQEEDFQTLSKEAIALYQSKLLNEFKYNLDTFEKTKNLKVSYKQQIQLLHVASSKFLACYQKEARFESSNYRMTLDDLPSEASLFKILPAYKYQREGEYQQVIYGSDIVYIVRAVQFMNKETFLHASGEMGDFGKTSKKDHEIHQHQHQDIERRATFRRQQTKMPTGGINRTQTSGNEDHHIFKKREINASIEDRTLWKLMMFSEYIPESHSTLKCGDAIWLHHSETNTTIAAARKNSIVNFEMRKFLGLQALELKIIEGKSKESYEEYIGDSYSMWIIEYEDFKQGGFVQYEYRYRFKHLQSGFYLAAKQSPVKNQAFFLTNQRVPETLFRFMPLKNQSAKEKYVQKGSYAYLCNNQDAWVDIISPDDNGRTSKSLEGTDDKYMAVLHQEVHKCDQSVFKLYASNSTDVWEIQFIQSCVKILLNYLNDLKNLQATFESTDRETLKDYLQKIYTSKQCLQDLDDFCNNKLYNSASDQKFGSVNQFRQRLLREQYYLDILMKILDFSLTPEEVFIWQSQRDQTVTDQELEILVSASQRNIAPDQKTPKNSRNKSKQRQTLVARTCLTQEEVTAFIGSKVDICIKVFQLISSICRENRENEAYAFNQAQHIVAYVKIIPQAINCLISIVKNNIVLLNRLSDNLQIEYDVHKQDLSEPEEEGPQTLMISARSMIANPLENSEKTQTNDHNNLLVRFMQLLEGDDCPHRAEFLKFLRSVCRYENQGINMNQENIFKLYKKFNDNKKILGIHVQTANQLIEIDNSRLIYRDGHLILPKKCSNKKEMNFIVEMLRFYGDVSFGRNYLWKKELQNQLEKEFLFANIWNKDPYDQRYEQLQPSFCKIAMSLYVDYEPFNKVVIPDYCRLFRDVDVKVKRQSCLDSDTDISSYVILVENMIQYLQTIKAQVQSAIDFQRRKFDSQTKEKKEDFRNNQNMQTKMDYEYEQMEPSMHTKDQSILSNQTLFNSMELLNLALELDLFEILQNDQTKASDYYNQIVSIVVQMLSFDKKNIEFVAALHDTQLKEVEKRRKIKREKKELINMNPLEMLKKLRGMMVEMTNGLSGQDEEEEEEEEMGSDDGNFDTQIDDVQMSHNPLTRGFIFLCNKLEGANKEDNNMSPIEIDLKLKICDILDHLLDMRQDFLISNVLTFFKHNVVLSDDMNSKEDQQMEETMRNLGKSDEEINIAKNTAHCERKIKFHALGLLPNIAKTGIISVDEPQNNNDPFGGFSLKKMGGLFDQQERKPEQFRNYFNAKKLNVPEVYDLDGYLSLANKDEDPSESPIACLLPYLLQSIYLMNDTNLERRCLKIITRIFNQREELVQNVAKLLIIFDPQKTLLYELLHSLNQRLSDLSDRSEIWFSNFIRLGSTDGSSELNEIIRIIKNLRWSFYQHIRIDGSNITLVGAENQQKIDEEKQSIVNSVNLHIPVINLMKDQMQNLIDFVYDEKRLLQRKLQAIELFQLAFFFLRNFCKQCHANQIVLFNHLQVFQNHLEFNLGQIQLICEIFQDNHHLLTTQINQQFLQVFANLIERFGRQERFLDPFLVVIRYRDKYLFDNQLQVLNVFLSSKAQSFNHEIFYSRPGAKDLEFSFEGQLHLIEDDLCTQVERGFNPQRDEPYHYHRKLLELLLASTLLLAEKAVYNPNIDDIQQRDNFTISVAKLKKTFKQHYLLQLLRSPDNLTGAGVTGKGQMTFKNFLKTGRKGQDNPLSPKNAINMDQHRKGMSILKKQLAIFYRLVHITSEKTHSHTQNLINEFTQLIEIENGRLEKMTPNENLARYMDYLIEGLIPLFISYYERVIVQRKSTHNENDITENEELRDNESMTNFANNLSKSLETVLFKFLTKKRHLQVLRKFFEYFKETSFYMIIQKNEYDSHPSPQTKKKRKESIVINPEMRNRILYLMGGTDYDQIALPMSPVAPNEQEVIFNENQPLISRQKTIFNAMEEEKQKEKDKEKDNQSRKTNKVSVLINMIGKKPKKTAVFDQTEIEGIMSEDKAREVENLWFEFKSVLCTSKIIEEEIEKETEMLATALMHVDHYIAPDRQKLVDRKFDLKIMVKQFINFLQYAVNNEKNKSTIITLLKVLRKVIEKEEDPGKKEEVQKQFNKLGATRMILLVLSESSRYIDKETYRHFLMFINSLMDGGNHLVQRTIYDFFTSYQKSEVIFQRFNFVIKKQIETISVKANEKKQALQRRLHMALDDDYNEQQETIQEVLQAQEDEKVMNQVLKFLQNCVEGHYLDLQNYIRQQTNSRHSYNMINQVADLLKAYYYEDRSQLMYDNMIRCLDTLNELVQGPCSENQVAVSESKFFDIASDLFVLKQQKDTKGGSVSQSVLNMSRTSKLKSAKSMLVSSKSSIVRKSALNSDELTEWMIARLQMKCLILILSLIEMRELTDTNPIIKRIMRNLPINVLQNHMIKCFKKYQKIYGDQYEKEIFDHVKLDPRRLDAKQLAQYSDEYFSTIIQNGFYIFFLMSYYYMSDPKMDNSFVQIYKFYKRKQLKQTKGALEDLLLGDNIIGQLVSFAMSLLEQGIYLAKQIQLATLEMMKKNNQMTPEQIEKMEIEKQAQKKRILRKSFEFFMRNSASIEVVRNDKLETVQFIKLPFTHLLPKEEKEEFSDWVDRGSTKSKVAGLLEQCDYLIEICLHEERLKRFFNRQKFLALFANYVKLWKDLAFMFTILLNLFIIGSFAGKSGEDRLESYSLFQQTQYSTDKTKEIFSICGIIMSCCSIFVVLFFLCKNAPLIVQKAWNEKTPFDGKEMNFLLSLVVVTVKLLTVLIFILKEIEVIYYLAYGALAILGTVYHPFFFSFHLTEILIRYPTLKNVIMAVYMPREQLLLTLVLFVILVYVYGLIGYTFFSEYYDGHCQSTLYCFLFTFDWTFKANAGVGGYLTGLEDSNDHPPSEKYNWQRFLFDNSSNIFLVIIMVNIVAGIIIDTFGSLREGESAKIRDIEDKCFICGNLKTTFDRLSDSGDGGGGGFAHHIRINHYMWNYLFFIAYLKDKDPNEYTGIEQYIMHKFLKRDMNWFPFNKASELMGLEENEEDGVVRMNRIYSDVTTIKEGVIKTSKTINQIKPKKIPQMNANAGQDQD